ncbi:Crp/Fnr family transcriptional regulator [Erysipelotrichaceae bacterium RD49]|nr:Crp/Fnr family transcriptional regulator [Erysipelotrichaceae bacterium RD49]
MQSQPNQVREILPKYCSILQSCDLFKTFSCNDLDTLLGLLKAEIRHYPKGTTIYAPTKQASRPGLLLSGKAKLIFLDEHNQPVFLRLIEPAQSFGLALTCLDQKQSPAVLQASDDSDVLFLSFDTLLHPDPQKEVDPLLYRFNANLLQQISSQIFLLNQRLRLVCQKRLRDKIRIYLQSLPLQEDQTIILPLNRAELADYLNADRSALSRELSHLASEKILQHDHNQIQILDPSFLETTIK